ncbi:MAG: zinc ribbon domain-containing protein [Methanomassiliicoccales archaeon]|jgi:RNA polymerase subunit RPABC4/transcription elongation factor Spt4
MGKFSATIMGTVGAIIFLPLVFLLMVFYIDLEQRNPYEDYSINPVVLVLLIMGAIIGVILLTVAIRAYVRGPVRRESNERGLADVSSRMEKTQQQEPLCRSCGAKLEADFSICPMCKTPVRKTYQCLNCGRELRPGFKACPYCGKEL